MNGKDVIIIGSGLGGLSSGVFLAKAGYRVVVLEQSTQIGGCLQCFKRKGVKFETGMHFIGSADKGQILYKLMRNLEIEDKVQLSRLDPDGYDVISLCGKKYKFANGREAFIKQMADYFPDQQTNLERYWDLIENVANSSSVHTLRLEEDNTVTNLEYQMRSMDEVIDSVITDPLLAKVLAGNLPLYGAEKGKTPFSMHAFIMDFYNQSAFRVVGGSDSIAQALQTVLNKYGGRVLLRHKVTEIMCDDQNAVGVLCENGEVYRADIVISSAHPFRTLEMLGNTPLIRNAYRRRILNIDQTIGGFAVYFHFKKDTVPYMNYNYYVYNQDTPWDCEHYSCEDWPKGYLYMHFCHEPNPQYAKAGVVLSYMRMEDVNQWQGTQIGKRGADYEAFKKKHAETLINSLEKEFPGIRSCIEDYYTSTPLTYLDYTGTEAGSMYGVAKDVNKGIGGRVSHRTRIPNLLLAGQNVNSHGMLGTLVGSIITCSEILDKQQLYNDISNADL